MKIDHTSLFVRDTSLNLLFSHLTTYIERSFLPLVSKVRGMSESCFYYALMLLVFLWIEHYFEQGFSSKSFYPQMVLSWYLSHPPGKLPSQETAISVPSVSTSTRSKAFPLHDHGSTVHPRKKKKQNSRLGIVQPCHTMRDRAGKAQLVSWDPFFSCF